MVRPPPAGFANTTGQFLTHTVDFLLARVAELVNPASNNRFNEQLRREDRARMLWSLPGGVCDQSSRSLAAISL